MKKSLSFSNSRSLLHLFSLFKKAGFDMHDCSILKNFTAGFSRRFANLKRLAISTFLLSVMVGVGQQSNASSIGVYPVAVVVSPSHIATVNDSGSNFVANAISGQKLIAYNGNYYFSGGYWFGVYLVGDPPSGYIQQWNSNYGPDTSSEEDKTNDYVTVGPNAGNYPTNGLNVRPSASTSSTPLGKIWNNYIFATTGNTSPAGNGCDGTWREIYIQPNLNNGKGWACSYSNVYGQLLSAPTGGTTPNKPSNLTAAAASASQINLAWTDNSSNESGFKIEWKIGVSGTWAETVSPAPANATAIYVTGLSASTQYYFRIRAYNSGYTGYSNEANATTQAATPPTITVSLCSWNFGNVAVNTLVCNSNISIANGASGGTAFSNLDMSMKTLVVAPS